MCPLNPKKQKKNALGEWPEGLSQIFLKFVPVSCFRFREMELPTGVQEQGDLF